MSVVSQSPAAARNSRRPAPRTAVAAEALEGRALMSALFLVPAVGPAPFVAAGDVNGDGRADLVVAQNSVRVTQVGNVVKKVPQASVQVRLGKGDGTFGPATKGLLLPAVQIAGVALGDFNGDKKVDVALLEGDGSAHPGGVNVLAGNGAGTLRAPVLAGQFAAGVRGELVAADFNGDGRPDLAVNPVNQRGIIAILIGLLRTGGGSAFAKQQTAKLPYNSVRSMAAGDLNGDGRADLAVALGDGSVRVATAAITDGTSNTIVFADAGPVQGVAGGIRVAVGDVNGDGRVDVVTMGDGSVRVALSDGKAGLLPAVQSQATLPAIGQQRALLADLNGDRRADLLYTDASGGPHLFGYGQKNGTFARIP